MVTMKIGSKWIGSDMTVFFVRDIEHKDDGIWVIYHKQNEDKEYRCLIGAFLQRFSEHVN